MDFRIEPRPYDDPDVVRLVAAVQAEYVERYGGPDAAVVTPGEFDPPDGLFLVGILDGEAVVTGGWRRIDDGTGEHIVEIKRMYVGAGARRRGLARMVLAELEATAQAAGAIRIVLNTGDGQPEAVALYESSGYLPTAGYGHYACAPRSLFYGKTLGSASAGPLAGLTRAVADGGGVSPG